MSDSTVIIALNQCSVPGTMETPNSRVTRQEKIQLAAADSTQLVAQLVNFDLVKYCPTIWCESQQVCGLLILSNFVQCDSRSPSTDHPSPRDPCVSVIARTEAAPYESV